MDDVRDETLMAIADGELEHTSGKLPAIDQLSPEQRARLALFEKTRQPIGVLYREIEEEPVPQRLLDAVEFVSQPHVRAASSGAGAQRALLLTRFFVAWLEAPAMRTAFAALAGMAVGVGGVLLATGGDEERSIHSQVPAGLFRVAGDGRVVADGALKRALETSVSGKGGVRVDLNGSRLQVDMRLTFLSAYGYCRQYELETDHTQPLAGIGCRQNDGIWTIQMQLPMTGDGRANSGMRIASTSTELLSDIVDKMSIGDAFDASEEGDAIARGWQRNRFSD